MLGTYGNKALGLDRLQSGGFRTLPTVSLRADILRGGAEFPSELVAQQLGHPAWYAVRSSSATEDTETSAAAGAFLTELGVHLKQLGAAA
ncbi:MAG: hypothetical protein ACO31K_07350, partial [Schleiferiaceae bacterium]